MDAIGAMAFNLVLQSMNTTLLHENAPANMRASEIRYRRLFEAARDGILILNPDTRKITDANPFMIELLGYSHNELLGKELWEIGLLRDEKANQATFRELKENHYVRYENLPLKSKSGQCHEVEFVSNIYDEGGTDVIQCNIRDITERKKAQDEIEKLNNDLERRVSLRTTELKEANQELQSFSYSISHDLRAPLRAMGGFTRILEKELGNQISDEAEYAMERIRVNTVKMGDLIDGLLNFSSLGRRELVKREVAPSSLVSQILEELRTELDGRRVKFEVSPLPKCRADGTLLKQVYANLLSNAIKYSRGGDPAVIKIGCRQEKGQNIYFVEDNGVGFDMQYTNKLFQVFQRLHRSDQFEGAGVGLAIVHRIVQRHGGRVWAESRVGHGAVFYFTLEHHE